jgi:hypothetical protein
MPTRSAPPTPSANGWLARTTKISRSRRGSCLRACVRTSPRCMRSPARRTTSRTRGEGPTRNGCGCWMIGRIGCTRALRNALLTTECIAGHDDARLDRSSDALCTALQLTNFWQDLDRDWQNGRLYVPLDDVDAEGARLQDLDDRRMTEAWQRTMRRVAARTRQSFDAGRDVCDGVRGRLRYELRLRRADSRSARSR